MANQISQHTLQSMWEIVEQALDLVRKNISCYLVFLLQYSCRTG
jgi:hypothetical protein